MLYSWLYSLREVVSAFNVFRYLTFRTALAVGTALVLSLVLGPMIIRALRRLSVGQEVRAEGPQSHHSKQGTPTMGGVLILVSVVLPTLLWADLTNRYVWMAVAVTLAFGAIGFIDDFMKVRRRHSKGMRARVKLVLQLIIGLGLAWAVVNTGEGFSSSVALPFFKRAIFDLGWLYIPFVAVLLTGSSNAVNLTDGLDGLAIGSTLIVASTYTVFTYIAGNRVVSEYLQVAYVPGVGEVSVFCGALVGASLGFLWFNCHPAEVFMGDVGSLAIGAAIGTVAVLSKQEILLALVGGLFVIEALSVIVQVLSFKSTGRRVLRMAPIHHHFELGGWAEPKVIVRFWIVSIFFALMSLATLKLR